MTKPSPGPLDSATLKAIVDIAGVSVAAWRLPVLDTCVRLGVFEQLSRAGAGATQLASRIGCPEPSLRRLLVAAHACGFLRRDGACYHNSDAVERTLVAGRHGYLGRWIRLTGRWTRAWMGLEQAVRTNRCVEDPGLHLGGDEDYTADFIGGMHDYAHCRGSDLLKFLDLGGDRRLLDIGGGPATYSMLFAQRYPELTCTVLDLPEVLAIARRNVDGAGLGQRVLLRPGDYRRDDLGRGYDVAFLSDVLHQEDAGTAVAVLRRASDALRPGGRVVVQAMFLRDDHSGPEWPALQSLLMLLTSHSGCNHSMAETTAWLERAGFEAVRRVPMSLFNVNSLLVAHKP